MRAKCKSVSQLVPILARLRRAGKTIVAMSGSFDLLHAGHVRSLEEAKRWGDVLIVLLNTDHSVRTYKGPNRPVLAQDERAEVLSALSCVDYIALFDEMTPKTILQRLRPAIYCNGADWGTHCVEREVVEAYGGRVVILPWSKGRSTSNLLARIREVDAISTPRAVFLDRDGVINDNQRGYTYRISDFKFLPGVIGALRRLSQTDYKIIVVTNQSGIGRGYYRESDMQKLHQWMRATLKKEGVRIDHVYHCPHLPSDGCSCRKPGVGMFLQAARDFGLSLSNSWMVGDDERDVRAGREANIRTIKIGAKLSSRNPVQPHSYAKNLGEAVRYILSFSRAS